MNPMHRWLKIMLLCLLVAPQALQAQPSLSTPMLALYILAYDNQPNTPMDLTPYYSPTLASIATATANDPAKTAVVLVDLHGVGDTHLRVIQNGIVQTIYGLPDANGLLQTSITEYDVTDSAVIAGFIKWVHAQYQGMNETFTYIGHGMPLAPETDMNAIFNPVLARPTSLPPLPTNIGANPAVTDEHAPGHPYAMLTPYRLAQGLAQGLASSSGNQSKFAYIDLVMCFAGSIEEWTEIAPYASMLVGSPNYAFFDAVTPGKVLDAINPTMTAQQMADTAVVTYDALLPAINHPRILVSINAQLTAEVKQTWDQTSNLIYADLINPTTRTATRQALLNAYQASKKYDLTYCSPPDFELQTPDGLVDLRHFAENVRIQFANLNPTIAFSATLTRDRIANPLNQPQLISKRAVHNATPWFDPTPTMWQFDGLNASSIDDDAAGVSMYADLQGQPQGPATGLSWHAHWYHDNAGGDNLYPYQFISDTNTLNGWDEVFQEYWQGIPTKTYACIPDLPPTQDQDREHNDLIVVQILPNQNQLSVIQPVTLGAVIRANQVFAPVLIKFEVMQNSTIAFSETIQTTTILTGNQLFQTTHQWQPNVGEYQISVTVDSDQRVLENDEANNRLTRTVSVSAIPAKPTLSVDYTPKQQFLASRAVSLTVQQNPTQQPISDLLIQTYQFAFNPSTGIYEPQRIAHEQLRLSTPTFNWNLPSASHAGAVVVHIWAYSSAGRSLEPAILRFNYAPPQTPLSRNFQDVYRFTRQRSDTLTLNLEVAQGQNADLALWEPYVLTKPTQQSSVFGSDILTINPIAISGEFILAVKATTDVRYALHAFSAGTPLSIQQDPIQQARPLFLEPLFDPTVQKAFLPFVTR